MFRPVHRRLQEDGGIEVRVLALFYDRTNPRRLTRSLGLRRRDLIGKLWAKRTRFDAMVSADYVSFRSRAAQRIQIFHGCSFKNAAIHQKALRYDHLFTVGPYMRDQFVTQGICEAGDPRLRLIGMPKVDCLARAHDTPDEAERREILRSHELDPDRPTILYAPTCHENENSLIRFGTRLVRTIASENRWNLLIKLHDHSLDLQRNELDWAFWLSKVTEAPNVAAFRELDVTRAMIASDALVSDASSVAYEYALLDRPIVFFETEVEREFSDLETFGRSVGSIAPTVPAAVKSLEEQLENPGRFRDRRRQLVEAVFHEPGHATDNAVAAIREILAD